MSQSDTYPRRVMPGEVVNGEFATDLFRVKGGRALYDQVTMQDGGVAVYLVRIRPDEEGKLRVTQRWIPWDTELEQMFEVEE